MRHDPRADVVLFALGQLEDQSIADMSLLDPGLADLELARLTVMVCKAFRPQPALFAGLTVHETDIAFPFSFRRSGTARRGYFGDRTGAFKHAMRPTPARMNHAFGDAFVVKVQDLFPKNEIFLRRWPGVPLCREFWLSAMMTPCVVVNLLWPDPLC